MNLTTDGCQKIFFCVCVHCNHSAFFVRLLGSFGCGENSCVYIFWVLKFFVDFDLLVIIFWDTALCIFECLVTSKTCLGVLTLFLFIHFC